MCAVIVFHELDIENNESSSSSRNRLSISLRDAIIINDPCDRAAAEIKSISVLSAPLIVPQLHCSRRIQTLEFIFGIAPKRCEEEAGVGGSKKYPIAMLTRSRTKCNLA